MKRQLLFSALFLMTLYSQAQTSDVEFGVKGGINYASYRVPNAIFDVHKGKLGFYLGGFATIDIADKFKVQPELLFALQGSRLVIRDIEIREAADEPPKRGDFIKNINEYTIALPIMGQYHINEKFYLEGGPQLGFIISTKEKLITSPTDDPQFNAASNPDPDTFDAGVAFGAGYNLSPILVLNARYYYGFINRNNGLYSSVLNLGLEYKL